jgi:hypothetical protein
MTTGPVLEGTALVSWNTGFDDKTLEPVLIVGFTDGRRIAIHIPSETAMKMGSALFAAGAKTDRPTKSNPN